MAISKRGTARVALAVGGGIGLGLMLASALTLVSFWLAVRSGAQLPPRIWAMSVVRIVVTGIPMYGLSCLVAVTLFALCLRPHTDGECRCRKCGYILRGLSQPACPECGEKI